MVPFLTQSYFNPSSMYEPARAVASALNEARRAVAGYFGRVDPKQFLFTSCATESNNAALFGVVRANPARRHVITTAVEHPAVLEVAAAGLPDPSRGDESVKAWVVLKDGMTATEAELKKFCEDKLVAYKRPKYIEFRDDLPETMVGKVLRRELAKEG